MALETNDFDRIKMQSRMDELRGLTAELTEDQMREIIHLSRELRRSHTGPSKTKAKAAAKAPKAKLSDDDLGKLLDL